ncbi:PREDICTED: uncharacterized protein LOC109353895 [Lupinus angustifolius]|uniref:uncharacterized protein LOC109353895 n=1 Tax=Lupinus angustifolius TaxID=3871 RepID=UPI00092E8C0A|nr:PREDICTED: uncharacterized protein LOC109353895 [Lupinus angustifolius]
MICTSLNVRGLGSGIKRRGIRELVVKNGVDFLAIQETKMEVVDDKLCFSVWGNQHCNWDFIPSVGRSGGILSIWDDLKFSRLSTVRGSGFLAIVGKWLLDSSICCLVNVYSPNQFHQKLVLWEELFVLKQSIGDSRWCVMGDFNVVRDGSERKGSSTRVDSREMQCFNDWIRRMELVDLPLIGRRFTWVQPGGKCMSRLDRFFCRLSGSLSGMMFPNGLFNALSHTIVQSFLSIKRLAEVLFRSNSTTVGSNTRILKGNVLKDIRDLDLCSESGILSDAQAHHRCHLSAEWWRLSSLKESLLLQKSRFQWLKEEDANSNFFHVCMKNRSRRNQILGLSLNGQWVEEEGLVRKGIVEYFKSLFYGSQCRRPTLDGVQFNSLSLEQVLSISAEFSLPEIKAAVWSCATDKSPGPDEFNFNPNRIEDFRPISLVNSLYKILSKILASRLKLVSGSLISDSQATFIQNRSILDAVVVINEVIHSAKKGREGCLILKVDFEKAYDSVDWGFLDYMLSQCGFPSSLRRWVRNCLSYTSMHVLVNGSPTDQFLVSRGIRQGDPMAPFLFLLVVEGFSGLIRSARSAGFFHGYSLGSNQVEVSNLQYAGDTILSPIFGVKVDQCFLNSASSFLCCSIGRIPFNYLGIPVGASPKKCSTWALVIVAVSKSSKEGNFELNGDSEEFFVGQ